MEKKNWVINILVGISCASLGFGASQLTGIDDVRIAANDIVHLKTSTERLDRNLYDERQNTERRIDATNRLLQEIVNQNRELLTVVKFQYNINVK